MAGRTEKIDQILVTALEISDLAERDAYVQRACGADQELRSEVNSLLGAYQRAGPFLEQPDPGAGYTAPPAEGLGGRDPPVVLAEKEGDRIGRFKLLEQIGEGGFGVV